MIHHPAPPGLAHGESGHLEPVQEFPYEQVDADLGNTKPADESRLEVAEQATREMIKIIRWIWQDGMQNEEGVKERAMIVCWIFLPDVHCENGTTFARGFGKTKQALNKWIVQFRDTFPQYPHVHMRFNAKQKRKGKNDRRAH